MKTSSTYTAYRFVKKNRRQKKQQLTRSASRILIDKTSLSYLAIFGLMLLIWYSDQLEDYQTIFSNIESFLWSHYFGLLCFGFLRPLSLAFTRPGVLFSSSDLFLITLPLDRNKLWFYHVIDKIKQTVLIGLVIGLVIKCLTYFSSQLIITLLLGFWLIELLMIIPQWLLFQKRWYIKFLISQGIMSISLLANLFMFWFGGTGFLLIISLIMLILVNSWGYRRLFDFTDWSPIIETNDRLLRKSLLVSLASNIKIDPPKHRGFYHQVIRSKQLTKPFKENKKYQSYHRIIFLKFTEQKEQVIKAISGLVGLIIFLSTYAEITYVWSIIIVISLYAQIGTSFFPVIFEDRLIFALPWNLEKWRKAFCYWLTFGLVPIFIILMIPGLFWFEVNLIFILNVSSYFLIGHRLILDQIDLRIKRLSGEKHHASSLYLLSFIILFFGVIYSVKSSIVSVLVIIYTLIRYNDQYIVKQERTK
ncbi:hypothetical protein [Amphibacillus indicireducens]|uniref:ABC transporter permease n=1 Tax=Amphibacillus indicireducens TaxID=1076330 RepID=A0ABP7VVT5_9BACI